MPIFSNSTYLLFYSVPTDCRSIHIGLSVPGYPHRKRDQKGHLSGLQKVRWGLRPDKPQQGLASAGSTVDHVSRTREFLRGPFWGAICWVVQMGQGRAGQGDSLENVRNAPCCSGLSVPSALLPRQTSLSAQG